MLHKKEIAIEKKRVGIWIRVSTEDQARGESPEHHERRARYYAESRNWEVVVVYHLEAVSGKTVMDHPETQRMLDDIRLGRITGLIFSKLARLARNTKELLEFAEYFNHQQADLVSLQESIDTSTPAGRLFYTMIAAMAQWEREEIAERVAASVPIRAKLGKPLGGVAPFGYQWVDKKLIPHPEEAPVRKLMYELFMQHRRKKTVARLLNQAGHRTRNGKPFTDTTIDRLLKDPTAKGLHRANYTKSTGEGKRCELKPESEWIYVEVEAIVSTELWDQCNHILNERKPKHRRPARQTVHLFAGLTYCSCGQKMYVPSNTPKYVCQKCRTKIPIVDLEQVFYEQLKGFFLSPSDVANYLHGADEIIQEKTKLLNTLSQQRQAVQFQLDRLFQLHCDYQIPTQVFGERYNPLDEQLKQLDAELPKLQAEIDCLKISYLSSDQILTEAKDIYSHWQQLEQSEKRLIVENITDRITIEPNQIHIELYYLPSPELMATGQRTVSGS